MDKVTYRIIEDEGHQERIARTADVVSQVRYIEGKKAKPLFVDPFARLFVTSAAERMLERGLKRWPFFADYLSVRERFFDDRLNASFNKENSFQLVILGAGNDMRAERLSFLRTAKVFEVDLPDKIAAKKAILKEAFGKTPGNVEYIAADVGEPGFMQCLKQHGFDPNEKTTFLLQGLVYYMKPEGVDNLFDELTNHAVSGAALLFDQVSEDMSETTPYPGDPLAYIADRRFTVIEHALLGDLTADYTGKSYAAKWWVVVAVIHPF
ncbi:MAG: class I SAM-dependent methyltransferase [Proteobacteria bacterium]|nr:class I SAM-dependent methyltransferase [Pseudomonadota bacterium]